jgi:hypothetical protein
MRHIASEASFLAGGAANGDREALRRITAIGGQLARYGRKALGELLRAAAGKFAHSSHLFRRSAS